MPVRLAVNRPLATLMLFGGLVFFGLFAAFNLPIDFLPPIGVPSLVVSASYPGASPEEVRQLVAIPLEDAFASMKGIQSVESASRRGVATLTLRFHWGTDLTIAGVEAREVIDSAYPLLPQAADRPQVLPVDPNNQPVLIVAVTAKDGSLQTARMLAEREIRTALQQVDGVGSVILIGGAPREVRVEADQSRLLSTGLTVDDVASYLASANVDLPAGSFTEGDTEYLVRTSGRLTTPNEIAALRIPTANGESATIGDFASVDWGSQRQASLFTSNDDEAVGLLIRGRAGESPVKVSRDLTEAIQRLSTAYESTLSLSIVEDSSKTILASIDGLVTAGFLGAGAAFVVMFLFLRRLRPALILITAVPISILFCLLLLWTTGRSINIMSLGGIALSIGMLVDDGVVVLENLERRLAAVGMGSLRTGIVSATSEVASSILGSTLTTIIVFVPLIFLPGLIGSLYTDLALAVIYCLFASLVVSVTLIPVLFLVSYPRNPQLSREAALRSRPLERGYRDTVAQALRRPLVVGLAVLGCAVVAVPLLLAVRLELVAPYDNGTIVVRLTAPPSASIAELKRIALSASHSLLSIPQVASVWGRAGGESDDTYYFADPEASRETITLTVQTRRGRRPNSAPLVAAIRRLLVFGDTRVSVDLPQSTIATLLGLRTQGYELAVLGQTPSDASEQANRVIATLHDAVPVADITLDQPPPIDEVQYAPDREELARTGVSLSAVAQTTWEDLEGAVPTQITAEGRDYDVRVLLAPDSAADLSGVASLRLKTTGGAFVETDQIVGISRDESPSVLVRDNRKDVATIHIDSAKGARGSLSRAVGEATRQEGIINVAQSIFAEQAPEIATVLVVAVLLLYLLLGAQFESFVQPLIILVAVPLAGTGVLAALALSGQSLNLNSGLGVLVLLGTVVKVSIILFANYRRRIDAGVAPSFAVYAGSSERLRPILVSTLATICALFPVAINWNGLSTEDGIATAIIGGLVVSGALTLYVVPLLSWGYYRRRSRRRP